MSSEQTLPRGYQYNQAPPPTAPTAWEIRDRAWKLAERIESDIHNENWPQELTWADVRYVTALGWTVDQKWWTEEHHWRGEM